MDKTSSKRIQIRESKWRNLQFVEDIITDIFLKLPVKCIMACKFTCKLWQRLAGSPTFIRTQLSLSRKNPIYIIIPFDGGNKEVYVINDEGAIIETINLPHCENLSFLRPICTFEGLICYINNVHPASDMVDLDIVICNPATREVLLLPKRRPSRDECSVGLAFDSETHEYKVFRFFVPACKSGNRHYECEIYSSVTGTWRGIGRVTDYPMRTVPGKSCPLNSDHVCVNGKAFWFTNSEDPFVPGAILSVDMEENFKTICLPDEVGKHSFLVNLEGFLALVAVDDVENTLEVFILINYHESTWYSDSFDRIPIDESSEHFRSVAVRNTELFIITNSYYLIYDLERGRWRDLDFGDTFDDKSPAVFSFTESLLPCRGGLGS